MKMFLKISIIASAMIATPASAQLDPEVEALQKAALTDKLAYEITEGLTTEIGPRQGGTEAEARARQWSVKKLTELGFANVRIEKFMMPTWVRGTETAVITAPFPQKLTITALGNSGSTGADGLEAEVAFFPNLGALAAVPDGSLKGKIAFVSHQMRRSQDGSSYGAFGRVRFFGPNIAAQKGASAMVIRSVGTAYRRNPHTGNTNFSNRVTPIPAAALSIPDSENLRRMIERSDEPVKMKLVLTPQDIGQQESGNVIAEVPGSDPSLPMILIACHLDSWDLGTGAIDDGAGCGIITSAAHRIMNSGTKPKRTIRLLWAGAEEVGIWGGKDYAVVHKDAPHAIAMESDFGADRVWRVEFNFPEAAKATQDKVITNLAPLGIGHNPAVTAGGGADVRPIIGVQNLAIVDLQQDGTRYFDLHHTPDDTLDKIDPEQLRQNVAAWSTVLSIIANSDVDFTMPPKE